MNYPDLKLCPFCGGDAELSATNEPMRYVICLDCGAEGPPKETLEEASIWWNKPTLHIDMLEEKLRNKI